MCKLADQQCATFNSTNGQCTSCYPGYQLQNSKCIVSTHTLTQNTTASPVAPNASTPQASPNSVSNLGAVPMGCIKMNSDSQQCLNCQWGFVLLNGSCIERDLNCQTFEGDSLNCLNCYNGYMVFPNDRARCVLDTLLFPNCKQYNEQVECIQCVPGYVLGANLLGQKPTFVCNQIDPNCLQFNSTSNICEQCSQGTVLQGRMCVFPLYGVDPNCLLYADRLCQQCKQGWTKVGFTCSQQ
jgi:hypothetical protein